MAVKAGDMREKGSLQVNQPVDNEDNYVEVLNNVRGRLVKISGSRSRTAGETELLSTWDWFCWFETTIENNLTKSARWVIENRFFTINSYERVGNNYEFYIFNIKESE